MERRLFLYLLTVGLALIPAFAQRNLHAGLTEEERAAVLNVVLNSSPTKDSLSGSRYRVFGVEATVVKASGGLQRQAHTLLYDYTKNKTYHITNDITSGVPGAIIEINLEAAQPPPHDEEYAEAKEMALTLNEVKQSMARPHVVLQEGFPVDSPAPCDVHRCVEIQVNEIIPRIRMHFLLFVTADLSAGKIVEVRVPKNPTSMAR